MALTFFFNACYFCLALGRRWGVGVGDFGHGIIIQTCAEGHPSPSAALGEHGRGVVWLRPWQTRAVRLSIVAHAVRPSRGGIGLTGLVCFLHV